MAETPDVGVILFPSYYEAIRLLPDTDRLSVLDAILEYGFEGKVSHDMSPTQKAVFSFIRRSIDVSMRRYKANVENGKKGGRPPKPKQNPEEPKQNPEETFNMNMNMIMNMNSSKKESNDSFCSEPQGDSEPPVITLPLNDGSEYPISQEQCQEWAGLYPAVDVIQQLRNMRGWLDSNPSRRKTRKGVLRFITGWLSREQDRGRTSFPREEGVLDGSYRDRVLADPPIIVPTVKA